MRNEGRSSAPPRRCPRRCSLAAGTRARSSGWPWKGRPCGWGSPPACPPAPTWRRMPSFSACSAFPLGGKCQQSEERNANNANNANSAF
eukprot:3296390-Pyramimonas_sp.AAC.1